MVGEKRGESSRHGPGGCRKKTPPAAAILADAANLVMVDFAKTSVAASDSPSGRANCDRTDHCTCDQASPPRMTSAGGGRTSHGSDGLKVAESIEQRLVFITATWTLPQVDFHRRECVGNLTFEQFGLGKESELAEATIAIPRILLGGDDQCEQG